MRIRICEYRPDKANKAVDKFFKRPAFDERAEEVALSILADIRQRGLTAVLEAARRYEGSRLSPRSLRVTDGEIKQACENVPARVRSAVRLADRNIARFAAKGRKRDWSMKTAHGGRLGEVFHPFERVGVYVPGGAAPLASTALMTATLARVAGVKQIVACTPAQPDGSVNPVLLYAMHVAGVTEIYRVGGVQAIGLMAYGARGVDKVQKIVGPGGTFVTAAKRQVYGQVALDLVAGPSEIAILADDSAKPAVVAADLLSQAEHGTGWEKALLITDSPELAAAVAQELPAMIARLSRADAIRRMAAKGIMLLVAESLQQGMDLCNRFAPEHFELLVRRPRNWLKKVTCAGAVFVGPFSPESAGDFVAGPSHVLPTGGAAAMFSGLTVDDFLRRSSVIELSEKDLRGMLPAIEVFGEIEGLDAHALSAGIRFDDTRKAEAVL